MKKYRLLLAFLLSINVSVAYSTNQLVSVLSLLKQKMIQLADSLRGVIRINIVFEGNEESFGVTKDTTVGMLREHIRKSY